MSAPSWLARVQEDEENRLAEYSAVMTRKAMEIAEKAAAREARAALDRMPRKPKTPPPTFEERQRVREMARIQAYTLEYPSSYTKRYLSTAVQKAKVIDKPPSVPATMAKPWQAPILEAYGKPDRERIRRLSCISAAGSPEWLPDVRSQLAASSPSNTESSGAKKKRVKVEDPKSSTKSPSAVKGGRRRGGGGVAGAAGRRSSQRRGSAMLFGDSDEESVGPDFQTAIDQIDLEAQARSRHKYEYGSIADDAKKRRRGSVQFLKDFYGQHKAFEDSSIRMQRDIEVREKTAAARKLANYQSFRLAHDGDWFRLQRLYSEGYEVKLTKTLFNVAGVPQKLKLPRVFPDPNYMEEYSTDSALMRAAKFGWRRCMEILLQAGANRRYKNYSGKSALDMAKGFLDKCLQAVKDNVAGAELKRHRAAKCVALVEARTIMECAQDGDLRRLQYLVEIQEKDPLRPNKYGQTALHFAVVARHAKMCGFLVKCGADPKQKNAVGQSPLDLAYGIPDRRLRQDVLHAMKMGDKDIARREAAAEAARQRERDAEKEAEFLSVEMRQYTRGTTAGVKTLKAHPRPANKFGPRAGVKNEVSDRNGSRFLFTKKDTHTNRGIAKTLKGPPLINSVPMPASTFFSENRHQLRYFGVANKEKDPSALTGKQGAAPGRGASASVAKSASTSALQSKSTGLSSAMAGMSRAHDEARKRSNSRLTKSTTSKLGKATAKKPVGTMDLMSAEAMAIPREDDAKFELWCKMRYGNVA